MAKIRFRYPPLGGQSAQSGTFLKAAGRKDRPAASRSDFSSFCQHQGIFHVDPEITDRILDLCVTEQDLNSSDVARGTVDHRGFRPTQRVGAVLRFSQTDGGHPLVNQAGILTCAHMVMVIDAAREQILMPRSSPALEPGGQGRSDIRRDLELDGAVGLLLDDNRTVTNVSADYHVADLDFY